MASNGPETASINIASRSNLEVSHKGVGKIDFSVAVYTPQDGDFYHWALAVWVEDQDKCYVYEVIRDRTEKPRGGPFIKNEHTTDPAMSPRCYDVIYTFSALNNELETIKRIIQKVPVKNEDPTWTCQDYVLDVLTALRMAAHSDQGYDWLDIMTGLDECYGRPAARQFDSRDPPPQDDC